MWVVTTPRQYGPPYEVEALVTRRTVVFVRGVKAAWTANSRVLNNNAERRMIALIRGVADDALYQVGDDAVFLTASKRILDKGA